MYQQSCKENSIDSNKNKRNKYYNFVKCSNWQLYKIFDLELFKEYPLKELKEIYQDVYNYVSLFKMLDNVNKMSEMTLYNIENNKRYYQDSKESLLIIGDIIKDKIGLEKYLDFLDQCDEMFTMIMMKETEEIH